MTEENQLRSRRVIQRPVENSFTDPATLLNGNAKSIHKDIGRLGFSHWIFILLMVAAVYGAGYIL